MSTKSQNNDNQELDLSQISKKISDFFENIAAGIYREHRVNIAAQSVNDHRRIGQRSQQIPTGGTADRFGMDWLTLLRSRVKVVDQL